MTIGRFLGSFKLGEGTLRGISVGAVSTGHHQGEGSNMKNMISSNRDNE